MKSNIFVRFLYILFFIASCSQAPKADMELISMEKVIDNQDAKTSPIPKSNSLSDLKIIKNAECRFKVANADSIVRLTESVMAKYNGYVSDMRFQHTTHTLENELTARVPQQHFDTVLAEISNFAEFVDYKNISSTEVSEEYIDLEARLKTKTAVKKRYEAILRTKAKTVEEIFLAEEKLRELQEEREAAQARLAYLGNKVALSTIKVNLYETVSHKEEPETYIQSYGSKIKESLGFGWNLLKGIFLGLLYIWPLLLLGLAVILYIKRRKKRT